MLIYILITVACSQSQGKDFKLVCKPKVEQTYINESECKAAITTQSTCMTVKITGNK